MTGFWWWSRYKGEEAGREDYGSGMEESDCDSKHLLYSPIPSHHLCTPSTLLPHSLLLFSSLTLLRDRYALFELAGLDIWLRYIWLARM